jgi:two-component system, NtrC family, sensor kinase
MASLLVVRGANVGTHYLIRQARQRVGRDRHCEIHLDDTEASRVHAEINYEEDTFVLRDLGSSNGTFVNGNRVESHKLMVGDRIQIGRQLMLFRMTFKPPSNQPQGVDIVPSTNADSSQIVGRAGLEPNLLDETNDWTNHIGARPKSDAKSHWEIMYRTSVAVSRTLDIDQLLHQILDLIFQWVECDRGCVMLTDHITGELRPSCRRNRASGTSSNRISISRTILDFVCKNDEGVLTNDACDDQRWDSSASIATGGIREAICVPMKGRYGNVGVIYIDTSISAARFARKEDRVFNEEHLKMLVAIGHQAALAIEDTTYYQSMVQSERLAIMGQTIATLSHHIKNIVQGLKGGGFLIDQGLLNQDWKVTQKGWAICERNHDRIESLVMDMLTMSKDRQPEWKRTDLRAIVSDVIESTTTRAIEKGVQLEWKPSDEAIELQLDGEAIHRAVLNLVGNAIDACSEKLDGVVTVEINVSEGAAQVRVRDNGVGIAETEFGKIFSMFESSKGSRGTGLGLPVSLKIAKEHGGTIEVQSEKGNGTIFDLVLPRNTNQSPARKESLPTNPG